MASDAGDDIKRFAAECRKIDDKLIRRQINKRLKGVGDEGVAVAKAAASAIPSHSKGKVPLRPILASAVRAQWRSGGKSAGVSIVVSRARMGVKVGAERTLQSGGRVRVFGRDVWVQRPALRWFSDALEPIRGKALIELRKVMDDIADEVGFK